MKLTPRERAEALLEIHGGACSVDGDSDLVEPFRDMERERLVRMSPIGFGPFKGFDVLRKNYVPVRVSKESEI